jgi:4'-phosphopantetheinyl transferase
MIEIYTIHLNSPICQDDFHRLLRCVSEERKARILRYKHYGDACRSLVGDLLIRYALKKAFGLCDSDLRFGKSPHGKPILSSHPEYHFNLSHSGSHIVAGVGLHPLGVDAEVVKKIDFKVAKRFFSGEECLYLANLPEEEALWSFFRLWTLKESFVKAIGSGLRIPLNSFRFQLGENITLISNDFHDDQFAFHQLLLDDAVLSACVLLPREHHPCKGEVEFVRKSMDIDILLSI